MLRRERKRERERERERGRERREEHTVHTTGRRRRLSLGHGGLWHKTVLVDNRNKHVPLPSIFGGLIEKERHRTGVNIISSSLRDSYRVEDGDKYLCDKRVGR
eukprot:TRINITY_DN982_c0_g5_i7.p1 TRINITY_DN982_c0_g5~~TRINITY_DN982_c0_g5_i7.p1  ORF type:complete len:103 (+),score=0.77 TRINITY_DN982_c0_g5_i7:196-504(+)